MPLPKLTGRMTRSEFIAAYDREGGWKKTIEFPWVNVNGRTGEIMKYVYRFNADNLQCDERNCSQYQLTFVQLRPHGVVWTCGICRRTQGPIAWEDGYLLNGPAGEVIGLGEAWDIINTTGQKQPIGLDPLTGTENLVIVPG